jgi:hypothetical protein
VPIVQLAHRARIARDDTIQQSDVGTTLIRSLH